MSSSPSSTNTTTKSTEPDRPERDEGRDGATKRRPTHAGLRASLPWFDPPFAELIREDRDSR